MGVMMLTQNVYHQGEQTCTIVTQKKVLKMLQKIEGGCFNRQPHHYLHEETQTKIGSTIRDYQWHLYT